MVLGESVDEGIRFRQARTALEWKHSVPSTIMKQVIKHKTDPKILLNHSRVNAFFLCGADKDFLQIRILQPCNRPHWLNISNNLLDDIIDPRCGPLCLTQYNSLIAIRDYRTHHLNVSLADIFTKGLNCLNSNRGNGRLSWNFLVRGMRKVTVQNSSFLGK